MDLHGLVGPTAHAESLHVVGRVDLHCTLLHFAVDAHAVVDIVDLQTHTHTHTVSEWHVRYESPESHPTPRPPLFQHSSSPSLSNLTHTASLFWISLSDTYFDSNLGTRTQSVQLQVMMTPLHSRFITS